MFSKIGGLAVFERALGEVVGLLAASSVPHGRHGRFLLHLKAFYRIVGPFVLEAKR